MIVLFFYLLVLTAMIFFRRKYIGKGIFKTSKKVTWFVSGISLLMYYVSVEQGQVITGILEEKGIWGLWVFWPSLLLIISLFYSDITASQLEFYINSDRFTLVVLQLLSYWVFIFWHLVMLLNPIFSCHILWRFGLPELFYCSLR